MKNLVVKENETIKLDGNNVNKFDNITINAGGVITTEEDVLLLYIENTLRIKNGGCIDVSCKGHSGGKPRNSGNGLGAGISYVDNKGIFILDNIGIFYVFVKFLVYYGEDASLVINSKSNWRSLLVIGSRIDVFESRPYGQYYPAKIIEINNETNEIKIKWDNYPPKWNIWLKRESQRIAKYGTYTGGDWHYMDKLDNSKYKPSTSLEGIYSIPICRGSGGGGGHNDGEFGGKGGGILQIIAKNIIIENNGGIYCNGGKGIGNAGSGSGGTIYIKCSGLSNRGLITSVSLNPNFMNSNHIKIFINKYTTIQVPNDLCNLIKTFISNIDGSGKIFINCQNEYSKTGFFAEKLMNNLVVDQYQKIQLSSTFVHEYDNMIINLGGMVTLKNSKKDHVLLLYIKNNLIIKNGGCIDASLHGYSGGKSRSPGRGTGAGLSFIDSNRIYTYCGEDALIDGKNVGNNWRELLVVGSTIDACEYQEYIRAQIIEISNNTKRLKIRFAKYFSSTDYDIWLNRDSRRIAKYGTYTEYRMDKLTDWNPPKWINNTTDFGICMGSGAGGGNNDGEIGGNGGGILQIIANNIIIENNGGKGIGNAGSGSGGTIYIKCNNIINNGLITSISLNSNFMNNIHIKIYINQYINTQFPNELCNLIKKFISNIDGSGKIFIDCKNGYNKTGIFPKMY